MTGPEEFAEDEGATYREDVGWGHLEGGMLVNCVAGYCLSEHTRPHGKFTRWVIQSEWEPAE